MLLTTEIDIALKNIFGEKYIKLHGCCLDHYKELIALSSYELLTYKKINIHASKVFKALFGEDYIQDLNIYYGNNIIKFDRSFNINKKEWNDKRIINLMDELYRSKLKIKSDN